MADFWPWRCNGHDWNSVDMWLNLWSSCENYEIFVDGGHQTRLSCIRVYLQVVKVTGVIWSSRQWNSKPCWMKTLTSLVYRSWFRENHKLPSQWHGKPQMKAFALPVVTEQHLGLGSNYLPGSAQWDVRLICHVFACNWVWRRLRICIKINSIHTCKSTVSNLTAQPLPNAARL